MANEMDVGDDRQQAEDDSWPQYDAPVEGGGSPDAAEAAGQGETAGTPAGAPQDVPGEPATAGGEAIPKYRFDQVVTQRNTLAAQQAELTRETETLRRVVQAITGGAAAAPQAEPLLNERERGLYDQMVGLLRKGNPKLGTLLDKIDHVLDIADRGPEIETQTKGHWNSVARNVYYAIETAMAPALLGEGKGAADLTAEQSHAIRQGFAAWVNMDPQRGQRYEAYDPRLLAEYVAQMHLLIGPARRTTNAAAAQRQARTQRLPMGGSSAAPVGTAPRKPNLADDEEVFEAGWQQLKASRAG